MQGLINYYVLQSQNLVDRFGSAKISFQTRRAQELNEYKTLSQQYNEIIQNNAADYLGCARESLDEISRVINKCLDRLTEVVQNMEELASGASDASDGDEGN